MNLLGIESLTRDDADDHYGHPEGQPATVIVGGRDTREADLPEKRHKMKEQVHRPGLLVFPVLVLAAGGNDGVLELQEPVFPQRLRKSLWFSLSDRIRV